MRIRRFSFCAPLLLLLLCVALSGCGGKKGTPVYAGPPCQDVLTLPQTLTVYAERAGNERVLASAPEQSAAAERQKHRFFRPWRMTKSSTWVRQSLESNFRMNPETGFTRDHRPFPLDTWQALVANSNKQAFPSREAHAITVRHTNLRAMPTSEHYYLQPDLPGEGYPFDYFQHSSLPPGAPVFVSNISADGLWALVESSITAGWVPERDIAITDQAFMERWQSLPLAALVRDNTPLGKETGHIGALLPIAGPAPKGRGQTLTVYLPERGPDGNAVMSAVALPPDAAVAVPLALTPGAVARVGDEMMGQLYGWGGLDARRDCSALTRDLLAPFGLYLPRNSSAQAKEGRGIILSGLSMPEKEDIIRSEARPFSSLISMRGHIGLYIGQYNGKAVMFHNMWGLRTKDAANGCDGRAIVGKAVVTTLLPGVERPDLCVPGSFLERIDRISILPSSLE